MRPDDLETAMRELEWFHSLRALPGTWMILRVDGRGFSRLTEREFEKPFDERFHVAMVYAAERLLAELSGLYAYTESDEISVLLPPDADLFDREVEKIVSISAGVASAAFTSKSGKEAHFDGRMWLGTTAAQVIDYFRWRQSDAERCCLNGWCYWSLRKQGLAAGEATARLDGLGFPEKSALLSELGTDFAGLPAWQRTGSGLYWAAFEKKGFNPTTGEETIAFRRRIKADEDLPRGDEYSGFLRELLGPPGVTANP